METISQVSKINIISLTGDPMDAIKKIGTRVNKSTHIFLLLAIAAVLLFILFFNFNCDDTGVHLTESVKMRFRLW